MNNTSPNSARRQLFPWFYGWNVVAVGVLVVASILGSVNYTFTFWVSEWMNEFGSSRSTTMLALAAAQICSGLILPFSGRAMDRHSIRWLAISGVIMLAAAFVLIAFATSIWHIIAIYALFISGSEALAGPLLPQTLAARWFRARRGMAIGVAAIGTSVGGLLLPPLTVYLMTQFGWRSAHLMVAVGLLVLLLPLIFLVVRNSPEDKGVEPEAEAIGAARKPISATPWTSGLIIRSRVFWFIVIGFLPLMEITTALLVNFGPYTRDLGIDNSDAALLISLWSGTMVLGKLCFGALADRFDHRVLFYVSVTMLAVAMLMMIGRPSLPTLVVAIVILGVAAGGHLPLVGAMIGRHYGALAFGSAMGLFYMCIRPVAFGGPVVGWIRDTFGSYDYFFIIGLLVALACAPFIYWTGAKDESSAPVAGGDGGQP
jgi:MFS family permease